MTYDKRSFLSGLALGRQLKGWVVAPRGWVQPARLSGVRIVHRGRLKPIAIGALTAPEDRAVTLINVYMLRDGDLYNVTLGSVTAPQAVAVTLSGVGMVNEGVPKKMKAGELAVPAVRTPGLDGADMEITARHRDVAGRPVLPGVLVTPGVRDVLMVNTGI